MTEDNEDAAEARCQHIYNTTYAIAQLCLSEDELGAMLSAVAHAWSHYHGNHEPDTVDVAVNIQEEAPETPAIMTAVK